MASCVCRPVRHAGRKGGGRGGKRREWPLGRSSRRAALAGVCRRRGGASGRPGAVWLGASRCGSGGAGRASGRGGAGSRKGRSGASRDATCWRVRAVVRAPRGPPADRGRRRGRRASRDRHAGLPALNGQTGVQIRASAPDLLGLWAREDRHTAWRTALAGRGALGGDQRGPERVARRREFQRPRRQAPAERKALTKKRPAAAVRESPTRRLAVQAAVNRWL